MPIKRLSAAELKERRDKGLCYNCDEKFSPGHHCKKLFLIEGCWSNEENDAKDVDTHEVELGEEVFPEISLRAIYGGRTPQKCGCTEKWKAGVNPTGYEKFEVSVANGETLTSAGLCKGGCDAVLGAQWLRTLGPIVWDFSKLQMTFNVGGQDVELKGVPPPTKKIESERDVWQEVEENKDEALSQVYSLDLNFSNVNLEDKVFSMGEGMSRA
ncbi:unnamed protein product [Prunus armeniaca]|nr:unnamed protein product [Prunus armeniaca]